jgi:UDP-glucose 4-epimerase
MKVLLVGASGFLGRNILLRTPSEWHVFGVYRSNEHFPLFLRNKRLLNVTPIQSFLSNDDSIKRLRSVTGGGVDVCIMVWGNSDIALSADSPLFDLHANLIPLLNILESVDIHRFVFVSSGAVYLGNAGLVNESSPTNPSVPYGVSKLASELYIKSFVQHRQQSMQYVIARFFGAFGPYEPARKIYTNLVKLFALKGERTFRIRGDGTNLIDAMYVSDAVEGILRMATMEAENVTVNFAVGHPISIRDLVHRAAAVFGIQDVEIISDGFTHEPISFVADTSLMKRHFGFDPTVSLEDGIVLLYNHLRDQPNLEKET